MTAPVSATMTQALQSALRYLGVTGVKRLTEGKVNAVLSNGTLVVGDTQLRTSGDVRGMRAGEIVPVLSSRGQGSVRDAQPTAVLRHRTRHGAAAPPPPAMSTLLGDVEELIIADLDLDGVSRDVWFRNKYVLTNLHVRDRLPDAPWIVRWSEGGTSFVVGVKALSDGAWTYHVFSTGRGQGSSRSVTAVTLTRSVSLSAAAALAVFSVNENVDFESTTVQLRGVVTGQSMIVDPDTGILLSPGSPDVAFGVETVDEQVQAYHVHDAREITVADLLDLADPQDVYFTKDGRLLVWLAATVSPVATTLSPLPGGWLIEVSPVPRVVWGTHQGTVSMVDQLSGAVRQECPYFDVTIPWSADPIRDPGFAHIPAHGPYVGGEGFWPVPYPLGYGGGVDVWAYQTILKGGSSSGGGQHGDSRDITTPPNIRLGRAVQGRAFESTGAESHYYNRVDVRVGTPPLWDNYYHTLQVSIPQGWRETLTPEEDFVDLRVLRPGTATTPPLFVGVVRRRYFAAPGPGPAPPPPDQFETYGVFAFTANRQLMATLDPRTPFANNLVDYRIITGTSRHVIWARRIQQRNVLHEAVPCTYTVYLSSLVGAHQTVAILTGINADNVSMEGLVLATTDALAILRGDWLYAPQERARYFVDGWTANGDVTVSPATMDLSTFGMGDPASDPTHFSVTPQKTHNPTLIQNGGLKDLTAAFAAYYEAYEFRLTLDAASSWLSIQAVSPSGPGIPE